jgi:hypothetical protein
MIGCGMGSNKGTKWQVGIALLFVVLFVLAIPWQPSERPVKAQGPPTNTFTPWIFCADEHGICTFTGTMVVRYGAGTAWYYQVATGSIACNNETFGDPIVGTFKACYYSPSGPTPTPAPATNTPTGAWTFCANENGICTFPGTMYVRYGAGTAWYYQVATGSIPCDNATFGDPLYGTVKACYYSPLTGCVWVTDSFFGNNSLTISVYNPQSYALALTDASLIWPVVGNRFVNSFSFNGTRFFNANSHTSPTSAPASPNIPFASHATANFVVGFGSPGSLDGSFITTLNFTLGCSITYSMYGGATPTRTSTFTPTYTLTPTLTPIPITADFSAAYTRLLENAPDFLKQDGSHQEAQSLKGLVGGGVGGLYNIHIYVFREGHVEYDHTQSMFAGSFTVDAASTGNNYFGCNDQGSWWAWFEVTDASGKSQTSNTVQWYVGIPAVHGTS